MKLVAALVVLAFASPAVASWRTHTEIDLDKPHAEASIGMRVGSFLVNGNTSGFGVAGHVDGGVRFGRWLVYGEYGLYDPSEPPPEEGGEELVLGETRRSGIMHRFGANARFAVMRLHDYDGGFELYVEAGAGVQHFRWDAGGTWTRRDLSLGVGASVLSSETNKHLGATIGVRVLLAGRSDVTGDEPPVCGGPCDDATGPMAIDRSIMLDLTFHFGT